MLELDSEIELIRDEVGTAIFGPRAVYEAPTVPDLCEVAEVDKLATLLDAAKEALTNGEWVGDEKDGAWLISKDVYALLAGAVDLCLDEDDELIQ